MSVNLLEHGVRLCAHHVKLAMSRSRNSHSVYVEDGGAVHVIRADAPRSVDDSWLVGRYSPAGIKADPDLIAGDLSARLVEPRGAS